MSMTLRVTPAQAAAARLRVTLDRKEGRRTPDWVVRMAEAGRQSRDGTRPDGDVWATDGAARRAGGA